MDANSLSDQMVYDQIATNSELRAGVTSFLLARGYVSQADLQVAATGTGGRENVGTSTSSRSVTLPGGLNVDKTQGLPEGLNGQYSPLTGTSPSTTSIFPPANPLDQGRRVVDQRRVEDTNASTDVPKVLRQTAPYNLQSMRDLYTQVPQQSAPLRRFGSDVFLRRDVASMTRGNSANDVPLDVPLGPDYVVGAGDTLKIDMWGAVTQSLTRIVDRDGHILLPEAGSLQVAGLFFATGARPGGGSAQTAISQCTGLGAGLASAFCSRGMSLEMFSDQVVTISARWRRLSQHYTPRAARHPSVRSA